MFYLTQNLCHHLVIIAGYVQVKILNSDREKCHEDKCTTILPISNAGKPVKRIPCREP